MNEGQGFLTRSQKQAQAAFKCVQARAACGNESGRDEYKTFAMRFPALVHSCGLTQGVVFAQRKNEEYLKDLEEILQNNDLGKNCRNAELDEYLHLTQEAMQGATWLKRYVEAVFADRANDRKEVG